jgi:hypothetical protein
MITTKSCHTAARETLRTLAAASTKLNPINAPEVESSPMPKIKEFTIWGFPAYTLRQLPEGQWEVINAKRGKALKLFLRNNYVSVNLTDKFGDSHACYLHRVIRQTIDGGNIAAYIGFMDGDRLNLHADNLVWTQFHPSAR